MNKIKQGKLGSLKGLKGIKDDAGYWVVYGWKEDER